MALSFFLLAPHHFPFSTLGLLLKLLKVDTVFCLYGLSVGGYRYNLIVPESVSDMNEVDNGKKMKTSEEESVKVYAL